MPLIAFSSFKVPQMRYWRPRFRPRPRWRSLSAPPDPLTEFQEKGRGRNMREGWEEGGKGRESKGRGRRKTVKGRRGEMERESEMKGKRE